MLLSLHHHHEPTATQPHRTCGSAAASGAAFIPDDSGVDSGVDDGSGWFIMLLKGVNNQLMLLDNG